jgi:hypothetical protein
MKITGLSGFAHWVPRPPSMNEAACTEPEAALGKNSSALLIRRICSLPLYAARHSSRHGLFPRCANRRGAKRLHVDHLGTIVSGPRDAVGYPRPGPGPTIAENRQKQPRWLD